MKKSARLILSFSFLLVSFKGHSYNALNCLNQRPSQCRTLLGYAQYAANGCLYESNSTSKCKDFFLNSVCSSASSPAPIQALCQEIRKKGQYNPKTKRFDGKTAPLTTEDKKTLATILHIIKTDKIAASRETLRRIYNSTSSSLVKALCFEALDGQV